ncbi:hypothetical protein BZA77DRAFT_179563 [Pyronema omphalodes]|nr:hypothetical protein BZA77DRAFT_179563 [Pyronema omphalodes]
MPAPIDMPSRPTQAQPIKSNLTSQLRAAGAGMASGSMGMGMSMMGESYGARPGSITHSNGIPMSNNRFRRESMVQGELARSLLANGGVSWGGVSVGSWLKDDIIMTGTSPFTLNSPSYHSSSYLPKLEAEFCRDFSCCGLRLPSLHDLLRHYEEHHATQMPMGNENSSGGHGGREVRQPPRPPPQAGGSMIGGMGGIQFEMMRQQQIRQRQIAEEMEKIQDEHPDGEIAGDMEMDDEEMTPPPTNPLSNLNTPQAHLAQAQYAHQMQPVSFHSTPVLSNNQIAHNNPVGHFSPDSSVPGTPLATDNIDYSTFPQTLSGFMQNHHVTQQPNFHYGDGNSQDFSLDLCIDEPAKRLYSPGGVNATNIYTQNQLQQFMNAGNNDLAKKLGVPDLGLGQAPTMPTALMQAEDKPFKCPVIGCEKAYKNQNGLKYHKAHGHTNQQLHDNSDGTFSIVNPETSTPYPGTLGMEKEKPYRCEYCGKRYKNLNGLKYHRSHSTHPNSTGLPPPTPTTPQQQPIPGGVVAVAGGIGENNGMGMP